MPLESLVIEDRHARARILAGFGFNCYSFQVQHGDQPMELLWAHPDFASGQQSASGSGIPILFPFCGRIGGTTFTYDGRSFPLAAGDGAGNAIHGFVLDRPWRVLTATGTRVTGQFQAAIDAPLLRDHWPADFRITVTYELRDGVLGCTLLIENPDAGPLPFGLGTHPYFRVPIGSGGVANECVVTVPAARVWELVELRPTGRIQQADGPVNLAAGKPFGDCHLDDVLTDLEFTQGKCVTSVFDPVHNVQLRQTFAKVFRHCVVYTPPHREAICIEPYTCVPDPFRLQAAGVETGLRHLAPGHSFQAVVEIGLATC